MRGLLKVNMRRIDFTEKQEEKPYTGLLLGAKFRAYNTGDLTIETYDIDDSRPEVKQLHTLAVLNKEEVENLYLFLRGNYEWRR